MRFHNKNRKQAGDTIVEVLIATAVISAVLVGAFIVSSRSSSAVQDSAEHDQAQQYLQQEVETLRSWLQNNTNATTVMTSNPFCINPSDQLVKSMEPRYLPPSPLDTSQAELQPCMPSNSSGGAQFVSYITYDSDSQVYDCRVVWLGLRQSSSDAISKVEYFYKAYPAKS